MAHPVEAPAQVALDDATTVEAPARMRLADHTAVRRGFHGVWEASTLVECVRMIKSGSVTRLRVLGGGGELDLDGANTICTGLSSPNCSIETLWLRSLGIPSDAGKELALTHKCSTYYLPTPMCRGRKQHVRADRICCPSPHSLSSAYPAHVLTCCVRRLPARLTELYLEDNKLGEDGVVAMCFGANRTFESLQNERNAHEGDSQYEREAHQDKVVAVHSTSLASNRSLVTLSLDGNGIQARAMAALGICLSVCPCQSAPPPALLSRPAATTRAGCSVCVCLCVCVCVFVCVCV
jgi:hypothetical protein